MIFNIDVSLFVLELLEKFDNKGVTTSLKLRNVYTLKTGKTMVKSKRTISQTNSLQNITQIIKDLAIELTK